MGGQGFDVASGSTQNFPSRHALVSLGEHCITCIYRMLWVVREYALLYTLYNYPYRVIL